MIEVTPKIQRMLETGRTRPERDLPSTEGSIRETSRQREDVIDAEVVDDPEALHAEIETLNVAVKGEQAKRRREVNETRKPAPRRSREPVSHHHQPNNTREKSPARNSGTHHATHDW